MVPYGDLIREAALRCNAVVGATPADRTSSLAAEPLTATQIGSVEFPFTSITRAVLSAVGRIVRTYANIKNQPLRLFNQSLTANIAHLGTIPNVNSANKPIVGVYGAFVDASDGKILTEEPLQIINSILRSKTDGSLKREYYHYCLQDGIICHTRTNVKGKVVTFDLTTEKTAIVTANGLSPLPDSCFDVGWMAALANLFTDSAYLNQASLCENYVQNCLAEMKNGAVSFSPAPEFAITPQGAN